MLFWPATLLLGAVLHLRHALYDRGALKRTRPLVRTIAIGNLALGGTGKTPMLELVLRTLSAMHPVATLSRGFGRRGTDLHEVAPSDDFGRSGDEPLQVKRKFPEARVFVGADRVGAITQIQLLVPTVKVVVLDDALQHRRLDAGLNILLTTWQRPYCDDALVPAGLLRDVRSRARAAQVVVVTKCPHNPTLPEQEQWRARLGTSDKQELYFTGITYEDPRWMGARNGLIRTGQGASALLFTGIVDPAPLLMHARSVWGLVEHITFPDHHAYTPADLHRLAMHYANFAPGPSLLVTTEKDAARLSSVIQGSPLAELPVVTIGMKAVILNEPERFAVLIRDYVAPHTTHR